MKESNTQRSSKIGNGEALAIIGLILAGIAVVVTVATPDLDESSV